MRSMELAGDPRVTGLKDIVIGRQEERMRKPISKHGLRRALERVQAEGHVEYRSPVGTVVDKLWHEIEKKNFVGTRKKSLARESVRTTTPDLDT